jgi:flagellar hook-length control protein FliK
VEPAGHPADKQSAGVSPIDGRQASTQGPAQSRVETPPPTATQRLTQAIANAEVAEGQTTIDPSDTAQAAAVPLIDREPGAPDPSVEAAVTNEEIAAKPPAPSNQQGSARQIALAAVKHALASTPSDRLKTTNSNAEPGSAVIPEKTTERSASLPETAHVRSADENPAAAPNRHSKNAAAATAPTVAPAVDRPVTGSGDASADTPHEHAPREPQQTPALPSAAPARITGHASLAIAAFQAAAAAGGGIAIAESIDRGDGALQAAFADPELPASIVHSMQVQAIRGGGEAKINLNPGFLGQMTVGVQVDGASVVASLHASSSEVRDWIRANEAMLRHALAEQGFNLERLVVVDDEPAESTGKEGRHQQQDAEPRRRPRPRAAAAGTFEALI